MPNRIIKETIRTSKSVNSLSDFLFRVWIYLITYVDDYGRGSADAELLKGFVFPRKNGITEHQITEALRALASRGMIQLYEVEGEPYFCFPKWDEHQQIRAKKSRIPAPENGGYQMISDEITCARNPIQSKTNPNPKPNQNPVEVCDARAEAGDGAETAGSNDRWEEFWNAYPRKIGGSIDAACREYLNALESGAEPELLIRKAKELGDTTPPEMRRYIPAAEKWLRNKGWLQSVQGAGAKTNNPFLQLYAEEYGL